MEGVPRAGGAAVGGAPGLPAGALRRVLDVARTAGLRSGGTTGRFTVNEPATFEFLKRPLIVTESPVASLSLPPNLL